ncbi:beta-ketoacyl-ACP synthase [Bradyrhizobium sp. 2TAF24]|uniref:beta-ketoacyl-ACP synthase n=1 Tax=Bradyrhizobium sp. 2TAF24 TaxID=3233011 RepID=UPI003F938437
MSATDRPVWITGVGLVSCVGEGEAHHAADLGGQPPMLDCSDPAPYARYRFPPFAFEPQIPKKVDQRQMAQCQRLGTYAAGLALAFAGLKGRQDLLEALDIIATTTGGERDLAVDTAALAGLPGAADTAAFLNDTLMNGLRPTFFLGQLPNLLAGNIAMVHGVGGSARTVLGEESAGADAVGLGFRRVAGGQSDLALVGGACNGERRDLLLFLVAAGQALTADAPAVFAREAHGGGVALGSLGAFLVLESADHAQARGAPPLARLTEVLSEAAPRDAAARAASLDALWAQVAPRVDLHHTAILSGATGAEPATGLERRWLMRHADLPMRATGTHVGHGIQAQFPLNVAIAALLLRRRALFPACGPLERDVAPDHALKQVVVTGIGRKYGEGMALLEAVP